MEEPLERIQSELESRTEVVVAYLFGSAARGTASEGSDLDVAVSVAERPANPLRYRARLAEVLTRAAGLPVQVVILAEAPPALAGRIVREGKVLACRDERHRVRGEVEALRREFDTVRLRRMLDRAQSTAIRARSARG